MNHYPSPSRPYHVTRVPLYPGIRSDETAEQVLEDALVRMCLDGHRVISVVPHRRHAAEVMVVTEPRFP